MSNDEEISTTPVPSHAGSTGPIQPSSSAPHWFLLLPRYWAKPLIAVSAVGITAFMVLPEMFRFFWMAYSACKEAPCDWKVFVPGLALLLIVIGAIAPTWPKDGAGFVEALSNLVGKIRGK